MTAFESLELPSDVTVVAPDGCDVRVLLGLRAGGMAHFTLAPGKVSAAVTHCTVEEIWYVVSGTGLLWRKQDDIEQVTELVPSLCLTIPLGTHFQFQATGADDLDIVAVTMPPWPGDGEAVPVAGPWQASTPTTARASFPALSETPPAIADGRARPAR